jgi:hypothetical protein
MSPTCFKNFRDQILQADNKHTNEPRQKGGEEEAYSTKAKAVPASIKVTGVEGMSRETQKVEKNSKVDDKQKENVSEADKADSTKDTDVSAPT